MREPIRGHQRPSELIRTPSEAIRAHQVGVTDARSLGRHQSQSVAISRHQSPSVAISVTDARSLGLARREGDWAGSALVGHLHQKVHAFQMRSRCSKLGPLTKVLTGTQCGHRRRTGPSISSNRHQSQSVAISRNQSPSTHRPIHLIRPIICRQVGTAMHAFARDQPPIGIDIARRAASHLWGRDGGRRAEHLHAAST